MCTQDGVVQYFNILAGGQLCEQAIFAACSWGSDHGGIFVLCVPASPGHNCSPCSCPVCLLFFKGLLQYLGHKTCVGCLCVSLSYALSVFQCQGWLSVRVWLLGSGI